MKFIRWAMFLLNLTYSTQHIAGEDNGMAEILTRWMRGYPVHVARVRRFRDAQPRLRVNIAPGPNYESCPSRDCLVKMNQDTCEIPPLEAFTDEDGLIHVEGAVWVPTDAHAMQLALLTISHTGTAGHRGLKATLGMLTAAFRWLNVRGYIAEFVSECILCLLSNTGAKDPRPLAIMLHGERPM